MSTSPILPTERSHLFPSGKGVLVPGLPLSLLSGTTSSYGFHSHRLSLGTQDTVAGLGTVGCQVTWGRSNNLPAEPAFGEPIST